MMVEIDDEELTAIVGLAVFITFMLENSSKAMTNV